MIKNISIIRIDIFRRLLQLPKGIIFALVLIYGSACNQTTHDKITAQVSPITSPIINIKSGDDQLADGNPLITATSTEIPDNNGNQTTSKTITESFQISTATYTPTLPAAIPTDTPLSITRFAVIGDFGLAGDPERDVANLIKSWNPDFIITTGDNNYPDGTAETIDENIGQYFHEYIFPYLGQYGEGSEVNRFFPTLGNHDWTTAKGQPYFDYFTLPNNERYYDFIWGVVHLFAIDSDSREPSGVGRSSEQAQWLQGKLNNSTAIWKIVYMHQPPYSSSGDGSITWAQWPYKEWGATAVIAGHSHVYERLIIDGFPYFVNGLGGGPRYDFDISPHPGSQIRFRDDYGAMVVRATTEEIIFQFITRENIIIDEYIIKAEG